MTHTRLHVLILTLLLGFSGVPAQAQTEAPPAQTSVTVTQNVGAAISIFPIRILFEGRKRSQEIILSNRSSNERRYRITLEDRGMSPAGDLIAVDQVPAGQNSALPHLRYSPRQVVIPANGTQTIRIMSRLPSDAPDGEYRAQMLFQEVSGGGGTAPAQTLDDTPGLSVAVRAVYGIGIPVVIRKGDLSVTGSIENPSLGADEKGRPVVNFTLTRSGNRSLVGDVTILRKGERIGSLQRVAVYTSLDRRSVSVALDTSRLNGESLTGTPLKIVFAPPKDDSSDGQGPTLEAEFTP